jgi:hypothetical protein
LIGNIAYRSQELRLGKNCAVITGEHKIRIEDFLHGAGVVMQLHLIPEIFECDYLRFVIASLGTNWTRQENKSQKADPYSAHEVLFLSPLKDSSES